MCVRFYFACQQQLQRKATYYQSTYGVLPHFKAGIQSGKVTAVEIGDVKRDIAYHGDTLNTAARIQSLCNQYQKPVLVSVWLAHPARRNHLRRPGSAQIVGRG